jgi:hypothetical protein
LVPVIGLHTTKSTVLLGAQDRLLSVSVRQPTVTIVATIGACCLLLAGPGVVRAGEVEPRIAAVVTCDAASGRQIIAWELINPYSSDQVMTIDSAQMMGAASAASVQFQPTLLENFGDVATASVAVGGSLVGDVVLSVVRSAGPDGGIPTNILTWTSTPVALAGGCLAAATTTVAPTTTIGAGATTVVADPSTTAAGGSGPSGALPTTGSQSTVIALLALAVTAAGLGARRVSRSVPK